MEFTNFLEKNQRLQHQIQVVTSKYTSCGTIHDLFYFILFLVKKNQEFMDNINSSFDILPFSP
jgi:hypothetical protein